MVRNEEFLQTARQLLPELRHQRVTGARAVEVRIQDGKAAAFPAEKDPARALRPGDSVCLDFQNHWVGHLTLRFGSAGSHPDAPAWIRIRFAERPCELLEDAENYRGWISRGWIQQEEAHIDVLPATLTLPRRYAFRYVQIEVLDVSAKYSLTLKDAWCDATTSADDAALAPLPGKDAELATLDAIACRTLRECMQTVFEDGPKRDRRLWLGDLRLQALANYETYRNYDLVRACLYLFAGTADGDGRVSACLFLEPEIEADDTQMFDYSLFFAAALRDYLRATGDERTARALWPTALRQIELAQAEFDERGIVRDRDQLGWCFVDWNLSLNKQASAQGIYLYCLRSAIELAQALGEDAALPFLRGEWAKKRTAALRWLWDAGSRLFVSGAPRQLSMASQVWMVLGGTLEGSDAAELLARAARLPNIVGMVTPYMYHNYVDALLAAGQRLEALAVLRSYWGGMASEGSDTFWELYNPDNPGESPYGGTIVNSYCHAWSCAPAYFLRKFDLSRDD